MKTPKSLKNSGKLWVGDDVKMLRVLAKHNTPTGLIGMKLGRSRSSVRHKASEEGISLKPANQHPYNRRGK